MQGDARLWRRARRDAVLAMTVKTKAPSPAEVSRGYVRTPADVANALVNRIDRSHREGYRLIQFGVREIDEALTIYPGSVTALVGRPGMGKSLVSKALARREVQRIERDGTADTECVIYVSLEEPEEKLAVQIGQRSFGWREAMRGELADQAAARLEAIRVARDLRALWVIRQGGLVDGMFLPPLTTAQVLHSIELVATEWGKRPTLIVLDYLQLLYGDHRGSVQGKTEQVMAASNGAVRLARVLECPVVMAVQASRETDTRKPPIPRLSDSQWASAVEQDVDIAIGLCRPMAVPEIQQEMVEHGSAVVELYGGKRVSVSDTLMLVQPAKARDDGGAGKRYAIHVHPVTLEIRGIDWRRDQ